MRISTFWPADFASSCGSANSYCTPAARARSVLELGRGEQMVDDFDQAIVEVLRRMSEAFVRFLKQRVVALVGRDQWSWCRSNGSTAPEGCSARSWQDSAPVPLQNRRPQTCRVWGFTGRIRSATFSVRQIVDAHHDVPNQIFRDDELFDGFLADEVRQRALSSAASLSASGGSGSGAADSGSGIFNDCRLLGHHFTAAARRATGSGAGTFFAAPRCQMIAPMDRPTTATAAANHLKFSFMNHLGLSIDDRSTSRARSVFQGWPDRSIFSVAR